MTRQEIETKLRTENPQTRIGGVLYSSGDPEYEAVLQVWADNYEVTLAEKEAADAAAIEDAADKTELSTMYQAYQTFKDGNATNAQVQRAVAILIKRLAKLEQVE